VGARIPAVTVTCCCVVLDGGSLIIAVIIRCDIALVVDSSGVPLS
jgi:hypothetical protein